MRYLAAGRKEGYKFHNHDEHGCMAYSKSPMKQRIDNDWKFYAGDAEPKTDTTGWGGAKAKAKAFNFGVTAKDYQDEMWKKVSAPHDYVHEGDYIQKRKSDTGMNGIPEMETRQVMNRIYILHEEHFTGVCRS